MRDWTPHTSETLNPTRKSQFSINQTDEYMLSRRKQVPWSEFLEDVRMHVDSGIDRIYLMFSMAFANVPEFRFPV